MGVTKKEEETDEQKDAQHYADRPGHPKRDPKEDGGADKERSCFA